MGLKDKLTVEVLRSRFKSNFELVNYAIKLAKNIIETGRKPRLVLKNDNPARVALEEIAAGVDVFVEKKDVEKERPFIQQSVESVKALLNDDEDDAEDDDDDELENDEIVDDDDDE